MTSLVCKEITQIMVPSECHPTARTPCISALEHYRKLKFTHYVHLRLTSEIIYYCNP